MRTILLAFVLTGAVATTACARKAQNAGLHATVIMRDGTIYSGTVTGSSADQITIAGDDKNTYTLAMKNVRSVDYGDSGSPAATAAAPQPADSQAVAESQPPAAAPATPPPAAPATGAAAPPIQSAPPPEYHPPASEIRTRTWVVPPGTEMAVRLDETINSANAADGQTYAARITRDVRDADGNVVIPRGSNTQVVIRSASRGGDFRGASDLVLGLDSVSVEGRRYRLVTNEIAEKGREGLGKNKRTAEYTGGGAAFGAIIGAIAGHGKGAAIGALSGAGAGAATQVLTKGRAIHVPAESLLVFRLERPLRVEAR